MEVIFLCKDKMVVIVIEQCFPLMDFMVPYDLDFWLSKTYSKFNRVKKMYTLNEPKPKAKYEVE